MKKCPFIKKITISFCLLFLTFSASAKPVDKIKQLTLENGLEVFLLEDSSDALVHIEYTCRAGFSDQTQNSCGFFKLYSRLLRENNPQIPFSDVQCNADSSRYIINIAAPQTEAVLDSLSQAVFAPQFSDDLISEELTKLQDEVKTASEDMSVYLNSAIDSKVFSATPWKHDSGIYPALFKQITTKQARTHIKNISDNWYTPQNSAIFICGNINNEKIQVMLQNTFGRFYSSNKTPISKPLVPVNNKRKFVLHSPDLSPDLTQVVIQYTMLGMEECDILSASLNNNYSAFKNNLLEKEELNIPGDEYINVSSAHQKDNSRLIIQTLLQPPVNKEIKTNSAQQSVHFYKEVLKIPELLNEIDFQDGKNLLINNMNEVTGNSVKTMDNLSAYWAFSPYALTTESDYENYPNSITTSLMMSRLDKISDTELNTTITNLNSEDPFVFVIINSNDYSKNKKLYDEAGFEEITTENASWYVQEMYKEIKSKFNIEQSGNYISNKIKTDDNQYYERNIKQIEEQTLDNGIKIISKKNTDSNGISLLLSIRGGKLNSADNNGFEEVMVNIMASVIRKEINKRKDNGLIISDVNISSESKLSTSYILIDFQKEDAMQVCDAIKEGIIYGEIPPAFADKEVSARKYKKRLENGSAVNQMYSEVINQLYGKNDLYNIFETKKDILQSIRYNTILAAYPDFLDAGRYSVILSGDFDDNIFDYLGDSLGAFVNNGIKISASTDKMIFPEDKTSSVLLIHTFLTDIPAEEAGPQPAVLIPTTEFLDPVLYVLEAPLFGSKESALFKALLNYLESELQYEIDKNPRLEKCTVSIRLPENKTNYATIIFKDVSHTKEIEAIYINAIENMKNDLIVQTSSEYTLQNIKNSWTLSQMRKTASNNGTALLIHDGFEQFPENPKPELYLEEYNYIQKASSNDFIEVMNYFPSSVDLKIYSVEGKK